MFPVPLATSSSIVPGKRFWDVILLYHDKPHLINRKLSGVVPLLFCKVDFHSNCVKKVTELFTRSSLLYEIRKRNNLSKECIQLDFVRNILDCYDKNVNVSECSSSDFKEAFNGVFISVRVLLPRVKPCDKCLEIVVFDRDDQVATFLAVCENFEHTPAPSFPYNITLLSSGHLSVILNCVEDADTASAEWVGSKLFDKLLKWAEEDIDENIVSSIHLINIEDYSDTYSNLKLKYGDSLLKVWSTKTNTDPKKYIFEDIVIASYLICLWNIKFDKKTIKFVDVGCGNGLLVNILNQEGYEGFGIDVRRRAVWDLYPETTLLQIGAVTPESTYSNSTWIIGNHSDELTPWIPYMALRSSPEVNFFLLPCCPFDFNGKKFIRKDSSISQYSDYLNYIQDVSKVCGFDVEIDKLRIPSTKRTCLIGTRNNLVPFEKTMEDISQFIKERLSVENNIDFKPRSAVEKVRNCTQLDRTFVSNFVETIVKILLENENFIESMNGKRWNKGRKLHLSELATKLSKKDLSELKKECGGLQTLLKNHKYLFEIKCGEVSLREPLFLNEETRKYKTKPCWFLKNHPDGCLYDAESCAYDHCK